MNSIDCLNGTLCVNGMKIGPNLSIESFKMYEAENKVHINDRGRGRFIIRIVDWVESNGIKAKIKIEINKMNNSFCVSILPEKMSESLNECKMWLSGVLNCYEINDNENIALSFEWGSITAQRIPDPHYGMTGGDIIINYEGR